MISYLAYLNLVSTPRFNLLKYVKRAAKVVFQKVDCFAN